MTCPKCNKVVNPDWLCCPFHAELVMLKEKCPKCGEMEEVGRVMCITKLKKAERCFREYEEKNTYDVMWKLRPLLIAALSYVVLGLAIVVFYKQGWLSLSLESGAEVIRFTFSLISSFILMGVTVLLGTKYLSKKERIIRKTTEKEFSRKFPEYAEILKKAKGEEKWA